MAKNETGILIVIKAWLPVTGTISDQIASLKMLELAHETGNYTELLNTAKVEDIKTEQKTRRVEDVVAVEPPKQREAFEIPDGFYAARDEHGVATGEVLPIEPAPPADNDHVADGAERFPEPAATDDAIAERPDLETGTVTELAAEPDLGIIEPKRRRSA